MTDFPAVSVIIPMYNAEKYIADCLDSILAQTLQNLEVILVNDCSTDNSRAIVEGYVEEFGGRLKIFDNEKNLGVSASRNNGLRRATGEYVFFMDADDKIIPDAFEVMYICAKKKDFEVVSCTKFFRMSADCYKVAVVDTNLTLGKVVIDEDISQRVKNLLKNKLNWNVWLRLLRRDFLLENEIFFTEDVEYAENQIWTHALMFCAKKILYLPRAYYFYRYKSENSITWKERDDLQIINIRLRAVINGLKWIDYVMEKVEFFQNNPKLRHKVLDHFTRRFYIGLFKHSLNHLKSEIYGSIQQEFGKDFGEYEVLIPTLCTLINTNQKKIENLKKKLQK